MKTRLDRELYKLLSIICSDIKTDYVKKGNWVVAGQYREHELHYLDCSYQKYE